MRLIFSLAGLLVVVAVVAVLARQQLQALPSAGGGVASAPVAGATPAERSRDMQQKVVDDAKRALEQGMRRNEGEASR